MLEFCSFHPGEPEFPNIQFKNSTLPMGEYPCCGELALRFQPLFQVCRFVQSSMVISQFNKLLFNEKYQSNKIT